MWSSLRAPTSSHVLNRAVFFFPVNLWPPTAGNQKRALEIIGGLHDLGFHITLVSTQLDGAPAWDATSIQALQDGYVHQVAVHEPSPSERRFVRWLGSVGPKVGYRSTIDPWRHAPPGMRRWFRRLIDDQAPDVVIVNYARWGGLVDHRRHAGIRRVIDMIDLESANIKMWHWLSPRLEQAFMDPASTDPMLLSESCFRGPQFEADAEEFRIYDPYDVTWAISKPEADLVSRSTHHTQVRYLPMTAAPVNYDKSYDGPAVFATGPNPFNVQGHLYFVNRVLPLISTVPDFQLLVTGSAGSQMRPADGVRLTGFLPDLTEVYRTAGFAICPLLGGTGQPVKIVEAMAHGLPVVALAEVAARSPIIHGVNGLVATDATEFAEHVRLLWSDRKQCRRLGMAAREIIATSYSRENLLESLARQLG